jgi:hypothetical protein
MHFFVYLFINFISLHVSSIKSFRTGIPSSHLHRLIIPDDVRVLIRFDLLMMSTVMLETCREMKWINKYMKKWIRLVINKNPSLRNFIIVIWKATCFGCRRQPSSAFKFQKLKKKRKWYCCFYKFNSKNIRPKSSPYVNANITVGKHFYNL